MSHHWKCPYCNLEAEGVDELRVAAEHMWEVHGVPCDFTINGERIYYGPDNLLARWAATKLRTMFPLQRNPLA